jgi:hypothetical protein
VTAVDPEEALLEALDPFLRIGIEIGPTAVDEDRGAAVAGERAQVDEERFLPEPASLRIGS